jgi:plasmid stabilization system protein ParE
MAKGSAARVAAREGTQAVNVLFRPEFWKDVEETMFYLAREASESIAIQREEAVIKTVARVAENPGRGHPRGDLKPEGIRALSTAPFRRHLVFYRWNLENDEIEFYRVKHGAMNLTILFGSGKD